MKKHDEEFQIDFTDYSQLSYRDKGDTHVVLLLDNVEVGEIKIYTDHENEKREYICVNYEMIYLDTITKATPTKIEKQYCYRSSAKRFIDKYEVKNGKQKHTAINQIDENCFEAIIWLNE